MHGGMGLDHTSFRPLLDALGPDLPIIYHNHRGNGRSEGARDHACDPLSVLADDAEVLRHSLHVPKVVVLGHSIAAAIAVAYARRHPASVAGLVLCDPAFSLGIIAASLQR